PAGLVRGPARLELRGVVRGPTDDSAHHGVLGSPYAAGRGGPVDRGAAYRGRLRRTGWAPAGAGGSAALGTGADAVDGGSRVRHRSLAAAHPPLPRPDRRRADGGPARPSPIHALV